MNQDQILDFYGLDRHSWNVVSVVAKRASCGANHPRVRAVPRPSNRRPTGMTPTDVIRQAGYCPACFVVRRIVVTLRADHTGADIEPAFKAIPDPINHACNLHQAAR